MKEQKKIICCSTWIMILSFVLGTFLELGWDRCFVVLQLNILTGHREFVINFLIGLCTGAVLSLLIAWINYSSEKEKLIIEFSNLSEDFYVLCDKLKYLYLRGDANLLAAYYREREKYGNQKLSKISVQQSAREKLLKSYKEKDPQCSEYMREAEDINTINKELDSIISSYYAVSNFDFTKIDRTFQKRAFICRKSQKEKQLKETYSYIKKMYDDIVDKTDYWREFNTKYNLIVEI